jgi:hypothetical protein
MTRCLPGLRPCSESEEGPSPAASWRRRRSPAEGKVRGAVPQRAAAAAYARDRREAQACRCSRRSIIAGGSPVRRSGGRGEVAGSGPVYLLVITAEGAGLVG